MTEDFTAVTEKGLPPAADAVIKQKPNKKFNKMYLFCWIAPRYLCSDFCCSAASRSSFPFWLCSAIWNGIISTRCRNDFANFIRFGTDGRVWIALRNTVILACSQFVSLFIAIAVAAFLSQNVKGSRLFQTLFFIPYICSTVAVAVMWNNIFGIKGALNALLGTSTDWLNNMENPYTLTMAILSPWYGRLRDTASSVIVRLSKRLTALYEAASLDGANAWHKFRNITLPGIAPITFFLILSGFLAGLTIFDEATIMAPLSFDGYAGPRRIRD